MSGALSEIMQGHGRAYSDDCSSSSNQPIKEEVGDLVRGTAMPHLSAKVCFRSPADEKFACVHCDEAR